MDILPDVEFGPVRDRKNADALALGFAGIVKVPQFGPLVLWVPTMRCSAEREDAFFCTRFFFVASSATKCDVETIFVERLLQPFGLPHVGVQRSVVERVDTTVHRLLIAID